MVCENLDYNHECRKTYEEIINIINILNSNKIDYWIFGGISVECLREKLTRKHSDIDILIKEEEKPRLKNVLVSKGFNIEIKSKNFYRVRNNSFQIDILFIKQEENLIVVDGDKARIDIPIEFFDRNIVKRLNGFELRIAPLEFILRLIPYYDFEQDRHFLINLFNEFDIENIMKIKYICKRDITDIKLILFEQRKKLLRERYNINFY